MRSEFQLDKLHQNDGKKDARTGRRQQDRGKVKADDDEPGRLCLDKFFDCEQADCVEKLKAPCRTDWYGNHDAASSSQGWQKDAFLDVSTGKPVGPGYSRNPANPGNSGDSRTEGNDEDWQHNLHISTNCVLHMENVFSIVRQRYGRSPRDQMEDLDVNTAIWGIFMSVTLQAAVHLGKDNTDNSTTYQESTLEIFETVFQVTERLITDQTEITGLTTIDWQQPMWRETALLTDRAVQFATAKTHVFSELSAMSGR